jgi:peptide/nickel transport system permease protein
VLFTPIRQVIQAMWRNRTAVLGCIILVSMVLSALLAPWITSQDPAAIELSNRLRPPAWLPGGTTEHLLGTDHLGRDVLSRTLFGARVSLLVGLMTTMLAASLGTLLGMVSGYFGGKVDIIMRLADVQQAYPFIALAIALVAVVGPGLNTVILVLGIGGWVLFARVVQGQVLSLRERDYIEAARVVGANDLRIMFRHILPNIASPLIVLVSFNFSLMIVVEASLSFLGFGVQPPQSTWGLMLSEARDYMQVAWWLPTFPGLAIVITVLGANLLGDWMRDVLDPRLRRV